MVDVPKPPPNKRIRYDPDALDNFVEHLRSKGHCKQIARLSDEKLQTFTTLGGSVMPTNIAQICGITDLGSMILFDLPNACNRALGVISRSDAQVCKTDALSSMDESTP